MKSLGLLLLSGAITCFARPTFAEVNFSSYVKRNHEVLKSSLEKREISAFQKKEMYRDLASVPKDEKVNESSKKEDSDQSSGSSNEMGPGR